jgi:hypothetical protein
MKAAANAWRARELPDTGRVELAARAGQITDEPQGE